MSLTASAVLLFCALSAPELVVTVDDLPIASATNDPAERLQITRDLLAILKAHKIRAVGFVNWSKVKTAADEALLRQWLEAGHELGNHTFSHPSYTHTDSESYLADIDKGARPLAELLKKHSQTLRYFRYPYLRHGDTAKKLAAVRAHLKKSQQINVPVTIDTQDWSFEKAWREDIDRAAVSAAYQASLRGAVKHYDKISRKYFGKSVPQVLLLHANAVGTGQWDALFRWMTAEGHRFTTVDRALAHPAYAVAHNFVGPYGHSRWDRLRVEKENANAQKQVATLLRSQAQDWNKGDLKAFTDIYADDAAFVSPSGLKQGRAKILARYEAKYDSAEKRGRLKLEVLETRVLRGTEFTKEQGATPGRIHGASTILRWTIHPIKKGERKSGYSLVTWRRTVHGWRIEQDASM